MKLFAIAVSCASLVLFSCGDNKEAVSGAKDSFNIDSVKSQIAASNVKYGASFANNDSAAFVNCYTSDACILPPNTAKMCGPQSIGGFFAVGRQMGIRDIKLTTEEVSGNNELVAEIGKYEILGEGGVSFEKGKFIVVWKQEKGQWKMHRDQWNSDTVPAAPAK